MNPARSARWRCESRRIRWGLRRSPTENRRTRPGPSPRERRCSRLGSSTWRRRPAGTTGWRGRPDRQPGERRRRLWPSGYLQRRRRARRSDSLRREEPQCWLSPWRRSHGRHAGFRRRRHRKHHPTPGSRSRQWNRRCVHAWGCRGRRCRGCRSERSRRSTGYGLRR